MMFFSTILSRLALALASSILSGWNQWSRGIWPNSIFAELNTDNRLLKISLQRRSAKKDKKKSTHILNSSVKGSSLRNTYGYLNFLLNLSSISLTLLTVLCRSELRARITNVAFACLSTTRVSLMLPPGVHEDPGLYAGKLSGRLELDEGRNLDVMLEREVARP